MQPRTKRQREILSFITEFIENHGYEPSYQQIANSLGLKSKGGIAKHIASLENKGLISRVHANGSFKLELIPQQNAEEMVCEIEWQQIPDGKHKPAGSYLYVPKVLMGYVTPAKIRALRINDNAMLDEHICEDDIALIESKSFVRDGEIVAAYLKNENIILRKFYRKSANIELVPANEKFDKIVKPADKIQVLGVFRGLLRPLF